MFFVPALCQLTLTFAAVDEPLIVAPPATLHAMVVPAGGFTENVELLSTQKTEGAVICATGTGFIVTFKVEDALQPNPLISFTETVPAPGLPQRTFTVFKFAEPIIVPPVTVQL